jgi:hypothetical protein
VVTASTSKTFYVASSNEEIDASLRDSNETSNPADTDPFYFAFPTNISSIYRGSWNYQSAVLREESRYSFPMRDLLHFQQKDGFTKQHVSVIETDCPNLYIALVDMVIHDSFYSSGREIFMSFVGYYIPSVGNLILYSRNWFVSCCLVWWFRCAPLNSLFLLPF